MSGTTSMARIAVQSSCCRKKLVDRSLHNSFSRDAPSHGDLPIPAHGNPLHFARPAGCSVHDDVRRLAIRPVGVRCTAWQARQGPYAVRMRTRLGMSSMRFGGRLRDERDDAGHPWLRDRIDRPVCAGTVEAVAICMPKNRAQWPQEGRHQGNGTVRAVVEAYGQGRGGPAARFSPNAKGQFPWGASLRCTRLVRSMNQMVNRPSVTSFHITTSAPTRFIALTGPS